MRRTEAISSETTREKRHCSIPACTSNTWNPATVSSIWNKEATARSVNTMAWLARETNIGRYLTIVGNYIERNKLHTGYVCLTCTAWKRRMWRKPKLKGPRKLAWVLTATCSGFKNMSLNWHKHPTKSPAECRAKIDVVLPEPRQMPWLFCYTGFSGYDYGVFGKGEQFNDIWPTRKFKISVRKSELFGQGILCGYNGSEKQIAEHIFHGKNIRNGSSTACDLVQPVENNEWIEMHILAKFHPDKSVWRNQKEECGMKNIHCIAF